MLQRYAYDEWGRLSQAETQLGDYRYRYDSLGNRTEKAHTALDGEETRETADYPEAGRGNRLLSQGNGQVRDYHYNPAGSPEQIGQRRYEYDAQQRPIKVFQSDSDSSESLLAEYAYNRLGERIKKVVYTQGRKPKVTYYLYDGHQLTAEADETGQITAQYLYLDERPVTKLEGDTAYALHTDHLGAPRAVTDEDQQLVWQVDYSPFGLIDIQTQQITLNLRLPAQYADQETGTYYNYKRDYDSRNERYLTSDPIGIKGGINLYTYVINNPLARTDHLGLAPDDMTLEGDLGDIKPTATLSAEVDAEELAVYLAAFDREAYGDELIEDFASTGTPSVCLKNESGELVDVPFAFQTGLSLLTNNLGSPAVVYGDTIDGILAEYRDDSWHLGSIGSWVRNSDELQYLYPDLSEDQIDVLGIAIGYLPSYDSQRMHIALPAGATDAEIAAELKAALGGLVTDADVAAFLTSLSEDRTGPLLVDIYELYQEIVARYQTRLHSDVRVWEAEIDTQRAQITLAAHIEEYGELLDCESEVPETDLSICRDRRSLVDWVEDTSSAYIDNLVTVNNEMFDRGLMPLLDEKMTNQSQAREMFAAATIAAIGIFVPLTLEDSIIDVITAGLGRIRRIGDAMTDIARAVRETGTAVINRVGHVTDAVQERVRSIRRGGTSTNSETQGAVTNLGAHTAANNSDIFSG